MIARAAAVALLIAASAFATPAHADDRSWKPLPVRGGVISYADTVESCKPAIASDYRSCGLIECHYAANFCLRLITEIEPAAAAGLFDGQDMAVDTIAPSYMVIYTTKSFE